jgi:hypothetical protein
MSWNALSCSFVAPAREHARRDGWSRQQRAARFRKEARRERLRPVRNRDCARRHFMEYAAMPGSREELVTIQKRLVEEIKESVYDTIGRNDRALDAYYAEYRAAFRDGFERVASRDEITQRLMRANIAYFGDYHSLRSAQSAMLDLLFAAAERGRRIVLACEMVHTTDQQHVADFLAGSIDTETFLWRVKWEKSWGFSWASWRRFFEFAERHKAPLYGLNLHTEDDDALHLRDRFSGRLISALTQLYPERLIAVVYGDLHMAPNHLPACVEAELEEWKVKRRSVTVYQNSETVYWKLVEQRLEHIVDYVKLRRDVYVVMNATPLTKFQSFANWQRHRHAELMDDDEIDLHAEHGLPEQVAGFIRTICNFLGIELEEPENFELYTAADLDLLANFVRRGLYTGEEMDALKGYIEMAESAFFERARILYIGNFTIANAAEAAGRFVIAQVRPASSEAVESRDEFYARCMVEALAYFCSKIIDPGRAALLERDWRALLERYGRRRKLGRIQRVDVRTARAFIRHKEYERRVLETGAYNGAPRSLFELPTEDHVALTRALGRALGERVYAAMGEEAISKELIVQAMQDPIREPGRSRDRYFELLKLTTEQLKQISARQRLVSHEYDE